MDWLAKTVVILAVLLALAVCIAEEFSVKAKMEAQSKQIARIQARLSQLPQEKKEIGRFQVTDGTPSLARNIMLVDTVTGRVWLACNTSKRGFASSVTVNWCAMEFYGTPSTP